jgi:hypothetical protein
MITKAGLAPGPARRLILGPQMLLAGASVCCSAQRRSFQTADETFVAPCPPGTLQAAGFAKLARRQFLVASTPARCPDDRLLLRDLTSLLVHYPRQRPSRISVGSALGTSLSIPPPSRRARRNVTKRPHPLQGHYSACSLVPIVTTSFSGACTLWSQRQSEQYSNATLLYASVFALLPHCRRGAPCMLAL